MLVLVDISAMGNGHLERSAFLFYFICVIVCHFLQNNQQGQHKPGQWTASSISYFELLILEA